MEELQLSETLQRYFSDVFLCCDEDKVGTASLERTVDLIKSGNVPDEVISQISDICWGPLSLTPSGTSLTRKQFYSALKLVAAYQANIPIRSELLHSNLELPLPRFTWNTANTSSTSSISSSTSDSDLIQLRPIISTIGSSTMATASSRDATSMANHHLQSQNYYLEHIDANSSTTDDSEVDSDTLSNIVRRNNSTGSSPAEISSTASDSPTPTNSVQHHHHHHQQQDRNWTSGVIIGGGGGGGGAVGASGGAAGIEPVWHGLVSEEQRQLLGTEEESSDRHSSEEEDDEDTEETLGSSSEIWTINREQREYYAAQFRSLQPDVDCLLAGPPARTFFEKSRLPVHELRKIWQLADVTKDGALSLAEFMTAMHLVVLRRNHIELPDSLPPSLFPGDETPLSISPETEPILMSSSVSSPPTSHHNLTKDCTAKEWTKFIDSPTSSSNVSSPGPKPVNFDFQKITLDKDSTILHPVPLRVTPECSREQQSVLGNLGNLVTTAPHQLLDQDSVVDTANCGAEIAVGAHYQHQHHCSPIKKFSDQANSSSGTSATGAAAVTSVMNSSSATASSSTVGTVTPNANHTTTSTTNSGVAAIIQRPQPKKKIHMIPGPPGAIPPPPQPTAALVQSSQQPTPSCEDGAGNNGGGGGGGGGGPVSLPAFPPPKKEKPPPPPPRPFKTHGRSSSLDLNKLTKLGAPPSVPPRISPNIQQASLVGGGGGKKLINQKSEGDSCSASGGAHITSSLVTTTTADFAENPAFANFDDFESNFLLDDPEKYENVAEEGASDHLFRTSKQSSSSGQPAMFAAAAAAGDCSVAPRKHGAFEVYQRCSAASTATSSNINSNHSNNTNSNNNNSNNNNASSNNSSSGIVVVGKSLSVMARNNLPALENSGGGSGASGGFLPEERARWELFQKLQEENVVLLRICQELSQELADIREEKATLQLKLERQRERANLG